MRAKQNKKEEKIVHELPVNCFDCLNKSAFLHCHNSSSLINCQFVIVLLFYILLSLAFSINCEFVKLLFIVKSVIVKPNIILNR